MTSAKQRNFNSSLFSSEGEDENIELDSDTVVKMVMKLIFIGFISAYPADALTNDF